MSRREDDRLPPLPDPGPQPLWSRLRRRPWPPVDVLLLKTPTCPLCDEARDLLERHRRRLGYTLRVRDISDEPELMDRYGERVPVVFVAGRRRFSGHVAPPLLAREVEAARDRRGHWTP